MALTPRQERVLERTIERERRNSLRSGIFRVLSRIARRILRLEVEEVAERIESGEDGLSFALSASQSEWPARWAASLEAPLEEVAVEAGEAISEIAGTAALPPQMRNYLSQHVSELSNSLSATSYENVREVIEQGQREGLSIPQISSRLREREPDLGRQRADLISRNETLVVSKGSAYHQALASGLTLKKRRLSAEDERVRPEHAAINGEIVGLTEPYSNQELWSGQLSVNCRCTDLFIPAED